MVVLHLLDADDVGLIAALRGAGLPEPGAGRYFAAHEHGGIAGYVGLEGEGQDLLLRSLVVLADLKAQGIGSRILTAVEAMASDLGSERLHLLTTTAELFFARRAFVSAERASRPLRSGKPASSRTSAGVSGLSHQGPLMTFARLRPLPDPDHLPALDAAYLSADPARG